MSATREVVRPSGAVVAVVGRPNVGKSTLVNRLTGRRDAIVEERPGVTRDRTTHEAEWRGRGFIVVDTGGWMPGWARGEDELDSAVAAQAEQATREADVVVFVVDATVGVTEEDAAVAGWLRDAGLEVLLVANKVDRQGMEPELADLYSLGLGAPLPVSALHGHGSGDLLDVVLDRLGALGALERTTTTGGIPGIALIGRPNVGKSSLFNRLLGEERAIVHDRPGTTRDAIDTVVRVGDREYRFVDTAGLRKQARVRKGPATEYYSAVRTVQALDRADVALLVVDAAETIGEQEQRLARQVLDAGRAIVLVLNKWDLVDEDRREWVERERDRLLSFIGFAPLVRTSAATGRSIDKLLPVIDRVLVSWRNRVPTGQLNRWLADAVAATPPPMAAGRAVRIRYVTQVATGPPTFRLFTTGTLSPGYLRYLERRLRESFGFEGAPLVLHVRVRPRWEERESKS